MGTLRSRVIYVRFEKCMGIQGGHRGRLYEIWKVYGDPRGSEGIVFMSVLVHTQLLRGELLSTHPTAEYVRY